MKDCILKIGNLSAAYNENLVFEFVSFKVKKGEFVGLIGGNGSGKTTLFKVISGELNPNSGNVFYKNENINLDSITLRIKKGIVNIHQFPITFPDLYEPLPIV